MKRSHEPSLSIGGTALALGLLAASCLPTKRDEDRSGSGTELGNVVGAIRTADGRPAPGLTVTLYPADGDSARVRDTVTDDEGAFAFLGVNGSYRLVTLDGEGHGLMVDSIEPDGETRLDLETRHLAPLGGVAGHVRVIDPKAGDTVTLHLASLPFRHPVPINSDFEWTGIPAGRYWFQADYPGARFTEIPIVIEAGEVTRLPDTLVLQFKYTAGYGRRDSLTISSSQLPLVIPEKTIGSGEDVDSVHWVLNGEKLPFTRTDPKYIGIVLQPGMLRDTGINTLELRLYMGDTLHASAWFIDLDDSPIRPWAHQAVHAVFMGREDNPKLETPTGYLQLGTFQVLDRRLLDPDAMAFWNWTPAADADTSLPSVIKVPMQPLTRDDAYRCGEITDLRVTGLFPGDTVTFFLTPDQDNGGAAMHIHTDERFQDLAQAAWFARADWPLADYYGGFPKGSARGISFHPEGLRVTLMRNYYANQSSNACFPIYRGFTLDADGAVRENAAMPPTVEEGSLLLHFRAGLVGGLNTDSVAATGSYVYIDSTGKGIAGEGTTRTDIQLSAADLSELRGLLAPLPAVIPWAWDQDFEEAISLTDKSNENQILSALAGSRYLLSGGRGTVLAPPPHPIAVPAAKAALFEAVEAWLRARDLL